MVVSGWRSWLKRLSSTAKATRRGKRREHRRRPEAELLEHRLAPATFTWDGGGLDNKWSTGANWVGDNAPSPNGTLQVDGRVIFDDLVFPTGAAQLVNSNDFVGATFNSISISGTGYSFNPDATPATNQIVLGTADVNSGFIIANLNATNNVLNFNIQLGGTFGNRQFFTVGTQGATLRIDGQLLGTTGVELSKDGPGTLILGGDNTGFTGPVSVDDGALRIAHQFALGSGNATDGITSVATGATLQVSNVTGDIPETLLLNGPGISNLGALYNFSGNNTWAGPVILDSDASIGSDAVGTTITSLRITGEVSDRGPGFNLTKADDGKVILARANTYRGQSIVDAGTLTIQDPLALGVAGSGASGTIVNANAVVRGTLQLENVDSTRTGFTVVDELLTLNGFGFDSLPPFTPDAAGQIGALNNLAGNNVWTGDVSLASNPPLGSNVAIGVELNSSLKLTGVINDGGHAGVPPSISMTKTRPGRLIFTNSNIYAGSTIIAQGALNIRDSRALGQTTNGTTVQPGGALELERSETVDSVTGTRDLRIAGEALSLNSLGANTVDFTPAAPVTGGLRNINGTNEWTTTITLTGTSAIGVDPDDVTTDPANPIFSQLTVSGLITDNISNTFSSFPNPPGVPFNPPNGAIPPDLRKVLVGEAVFTNSNDYLGVTFVDEGWITIRNNNALGGRYTNLVKTRQPGTVVANDAAVHLKVNRTTGANLNVPENFRLTGLGITHRSPWLNQKGAIENVSGLNTITGEIALAGTAGLGAEVAPLPDLQTSELTMDGFVTEFNSIVSGIVKLGSKRLTLQGDATYTGANEVREGVLRVQNETALGLPVQGTTVLSGAAMELIGALPAFQGGLAQAGLQVSTEPLFLGGPGNDTVTGVNIATLTNLSEDSFWRGPITLTSDARIDVKLNSRLTITGGIGDAATAAGFTKLGGGKLSLAGAGTYRGITNINEGVVNVQNGLALGQATGGTVVANNGTLEVQGDITVAGEPLTLQGNGTDFAQDVQARWFQRGPSPIANPGTAPGNDFATGRITGVAGDPVDPNVLYLSAAGGGAWRSKDAGKTWLPLIDDSNIIGAANQFKKTIFTGAIAVAPTDSNFIYIGLGETNNSGDSFYGWGVLRSTDFGRTWTLLSPPAPALQSFDRHTVAKIAVDPVMPDVFYVAVSDNGVHGQTGSTGIWRFWAARGGWKNLSTGPDLSAARAALVPPTPGADDDTGRQFRLDDNWSDLVVVRHPTDNNPATVNVRFIYGVIGNEPLGYDQGGIGSAFAKNAVYTGTYDQDLEATGLPNALVNYMVWRLNGYPTGEETVNGVVWARNGRISVAASRFQRNVNYTLYASNARSLIYPPEAPPPILHGTLRDVVTSTNSGTAWAATAALPPEYMLTQGWYNQAVGVDPQSAATAYIAGVGAGFGPGPLRTANGGGAWQDIGIGPNGRGPHADAHAMGFDANGELLIGTDGGIWRFEEATGNWINLNGNLPVTQFVGIDVHPTDPNIIYGGTQDNGTNRVSGDRVWRNVDPGPGDGGFVAIDNRNPQTVYHEFQYRYQNGALRFFQRSDDGGGTWTNKIAGLNVYNANPNMDDFANFYVPYEIDDTNTNRLVLVTDRIYETNNRGDLWLRISPVLHPIPGDPFGRGYTFNAVGVAQLQGKYAVDPAFPNIPDRGSDTYDESTIYATTFDTNLGITRIWLTKNHGLAWIDRTGDLPTDGTIVDLVVDPRNRDVVYVVREGFDGPARRKVFRTTNAGRNWVNISGGVANNLPNLPTYKITIDPRYGIDPTLPLGLDLTENVLYVGNDDGVYRSNDGGATWGRYGKGMPHAQVTDIHVNTTTNTLVIGTYGRSVFDLPLDQAQADVGGLRAMSGTAIWTGPVTMSGNWVVGAAEKSQLTILGNIDDNGNNYTLTKIGPGRIILGGTNTYGGETQVQEGVLGIRNPQALGKATAGTVVLPGAAIELQSDLKDEPLRIFGHGLPFNDVDTGVIRNVSNDNTYSGGIITLADDVTIGVDSGSRLTIDAPIVDLNNSFEVTKQGAGTLIFEKANNYDGDTLIERGILNIRDNMALGTTANGTVVQNGAQLQMEDFITVNGESLILFGRGITDSGALYNVDDVNTWNGPVTLATQTVFIGTNPGTTLTISGSIGQSVPNAVLTKVNTGKLILNAANTYEGDTNVIAGELVVQHPLALGGQLEETNVSSGAALILQNVDPTRTGFIVLNETVRLNGTGFAGPPFTGALRNMTGDNTWQGPVVLVTSSSIGVDPNQRLTITNLSAGITGVSTSALSKIGTGMLVFPTPNTYQGQTRVVEGVLNIRDKAALGNALNSVGTGTEVFNGATLQIQGNLTVSNEQLRLSGTGFGNRGALESVALSDGAMPPNPLPNNNTWDGTVILVSDSTIGVFGASDRLVFPRNITQAAAGRALTKIGPGTMHVTGGTDNNYTGLTTVAEGTMLLEKSGGTTPFQGHLTIGDNAVAGAIAVVRLILDNQIPDTSNVTVLIDGLLDINNLVETLGSLRVLDGAVTTGAGATGILTLNALDMAGGLVTNGIVGSQVILAGDVIATSTVVGPATIGGAGLVDLGSTTRTFTVANGPNAVDLLVTSVIGGVVGLIKFDQGTMRLTANNTYVGLTDVSAGRLLVDGRIGAVLVSGGTLGGIGTVGTVNAVSGTVAPGDGPGVLHAGNTAFGSGSTLNIDINGLTPGNTTGSHDQLDVLGSVSLGNASLTGQFGNGFVSAVNDTFTIITATAGITGRFAQDDEVFFDGKKFTITYTNNAVVLARVQAETTTMVVSSAQPSVFGQTVIFTATVVSEAGVAPPGNVTFTLDGTGTTVSLVNGVAMFTAPPLSVGPHTLSVTYNGDPDFLTSSFGPIGQTVDQASTARTLTTSGTPSVFGQPVTFSVQVTPVAPGAGVPSGTVVFRVDGADQIPITLDGSSRASIAVNTLAVGPHFVNVTYSGDGNFKGFTASQFGNLAQNVVQANSAITLLESSSNPSTYGEHVTFTTRVAAVAPGAGIPTGNVTFFDGLNPLMTVALDPTGVAAFTTVVFLDGGTHPINVAYAGNGNFTPSNNSATPLNQLVNASGSTTNLDSSLNPATFGDPVTFTATVTGNAPGTTAGQPTGSVTFFIDDIARGTVGLDLARQAQLTLTDLAAGNRTVRAVYNGNGNFASSTGLLTQVVNGAATTTDLTSSLNPSRPGELVIFTATVIPVNPSANIPAGTVTFVIDGVNRGSIPVDNSQRAMLQIDDLSGGSQTVIATYDGDGNFDSSNASITQRVRNADTSISTITVTPLTSTFGQAVDLSVTVSVVAPAMGTPDGIVTFREGTTVIGTAVLDGLGQAILTKAGLAVGNHTIRASYDGNEIFNASPDSNPVTLTVNRASSTTTLSSTANPSVFGQSAVFARVDPVAPAGGVPTGSVIFTLNGTTQITIPVDFSGQAVLPAQQVSPASYNIVASYSGDGNFAASNSGALSQTVVQANVSLGLSSSVNPSVINQAVTFTASLIVLAPGSGQPGGTITFSVDSIHQPGVPVDSLGQATLRVSTLSPGSHTIGATYSGDGNFAGTLATPLAQTVTKVGTSTALSSNINPSTFGITITLRAVVTPGVPGTGTPTGQVTFRDLTLGTTLGAVPVSTGGVATLTTAGLSGGSHVLSATYAGDTTFDASASNSLTQVVNRINTSLGVVSSRPVAVTGRDVTYTITLQPTVAGLGVPTGTISFTDGTTPLGSVLVTGLTTAFTTRFATAGAHRITVAYSGDASFNSSTAPLFDQVVGTATNAYVSQTYQDILRRGVDGGGLNFWSGLIDTAILSRFSFVLFLQNSNEYRTLQVNDTYQQLLGRPADQGGLNFWVPFLQANHTVNDLRIALLGSEEYFGRAGGTNLGFIDRMFLDLSGQPANPSDRQLLLFLLQQFTPRTAVAANVLLTNQVVDARVNQLFNTYLRRGVDGSGQVFFRSFLQNGGTDELLTAFLVSSDEYFNKL